MDVLDDLRNIIGKYPILFFPYIRFVKKLPDNIVTPQTNIVIEGFPRSANTFCQVVFQKSQQGKIQIAHHLHAPASIIQAAHWNLPAIMLLRNPRDAIISLAIRDKRYSLRQGLKKYFHFYFPLWKYRQKIVIAPFEKVISNFSEVMQEINSIYDKDFKIFNHTNSNVAKIFNEIEKLEKQNRNYYGHNKTENPLELSVSRPSIQRDLVKEKYLQEYNQLSSTKYFLKSNEIYRKFMKYYKLTHNE